MRKIREVLRLYFAAALSIRAIARSRRPVGVGGAELARTGVSTTPVWTAVSGAAVEPHGAVAAGLERGPPGATAQERDAVAARSTRSHPEGLQAGSAIRLGLGREARPCEDHAPARAVRDYAGQTASRPAGCGRRRSSWPSSGLLHLRRGDVDADPAGLDGAHVSSSSAGAPRQSASGVSRAQLAATYHDLGHYGVAVLPARDVPGTRRRRRWPFKWSSGGSSRPCATAARWRAQRRDRRASLNTRPFRKLPGSRRSQFEQLGTTPAAPTSSPQGVRVEVDGHYYCHARPRSSRP